MLSFRNAVTAGAAFTVKSFFRALFQGAIVWHAQAQN
jgi:hypothetical protein